MTNMKQEELNIKNMTNIEKRNSNKYKTIVIKLFCYVCNSSMKAQCYSIHLKTNKHKRNLGTVDG